MEFLSNLNWVDVLIGAVIVRAAYIGAKKGLIVEIFKLGGIFCTVFITLHYFSSLSGFFQNKINFSEGMGNVISYLFLWLLGMLVFKFIRDGFTMLFHIEAHSLFNKWGGLILSLLRALLLCSLVVVFLRVSDIKYFMDNTERSFSASHVVRVAPKVYEATFNGFISKFFPTEELNENAFPLSSSKTKKKVKQDKT